MFIPPNSLKENFNTPPKTGSKVRLQASHLMIDHDLAKDLFGNDFNVHMIYYSERRTLMLAAKSDDLFKQLHKASPHMLKDRNLNGDKTIALHEILIDNEIDGTDRDLVFEAQLEIGTIIVTL